MTGSLYFVFPFTFLSIPSQPLHPHPQPHLLWQPSVCSLNPGVCGWLILSAEGGSGFRGYIPEGQPYGIHEYKVAERHFSCCPGLIGTYKGMKYKKLFLKILEKVQALGANTPSWTHLEAAEPYFIILTSQPSPQTVLLSSSPFEIRWSGEGKRKRPESFSGWC